MFSWVNVGSNLTRMLCACSLLLSVACSADPAPSPDPSQPYSDREWILRMVRVETMDRMLLEHGGDEVLRLITEDEQQVLLENGVMYSVDGGFRMVRDPEEWSSPGGERIIDVTLTDIDDTLSNMIGDNGVDWCGREMGGDDFVEEYMDRFEGEFNSQGEFRASIVDYVDCGSGFPEGS